MKDEDQGRARFRSCRREVHRRAARYDYMLLRVPRRLELCGEMGDGGVRRRRIVAVAKTARTSRRSDTPWRRLLPLSHSARSIRSMIH